MKNYYAVASTEALGKHIRLIKKVNITLPLINLNKDLEININFGLA